jgi:tetratricopeptide (TPR) repeat protein
VEGKATEDRIMLGHSQPLPPFVHSSIIEAYLALGEYHSAGLFLGDGRWFVENENASFGFNTNAIVYLGMKDFAKAMANCKEAIRRKPDFAVAYSTCGSIARELGNLRQAVSFYDEAIRLQPSFVNAWAGRGVSNARQGELDRATIDCDRALQLNSKYSYAYYCRGLIAEAKGTLLLAAREFETALSIEPAETLYLQAWSRATKAPISHEKRVALVIGNADYKSAPLRSPVRDADAVAVALEKVGFKVIKGANANRRTMSLMLEEFWDNTYDADVALVYFSGHGGEYKGQNYLIPVDDAADDSAFVSHAFKEDVFKNKYIDLQGWVAGLRIKEPGDKRTVSLRRGPPCAVRWRVKT